MWAFKSPQRVQGVHEFANERCKLSLVVELNSRGQLGPAQIGVDDGLMKGPKADSEEQIIEVRRGWGA